MLGRVLICAIAMLGFAAPAVAGERIASGMMPDTLSLLMQDQAATFGSPGPGFEAPRSEPLPDTLTRFDALMVPTATLGLTSETSMTNRAPLRALADRAVPFDARRAIADVMADYPRPYRPRSALDTMVTLRLDGEPRTRALDVGGVAGAVWSMMPRR
jgi:hypothetical protein